MPITSAGSNGGRTEMFRDLGLPYSRIEQQGVSMPVSEVWCKFRAPVRYDDLLVIETRLDTKIRGSMKFDYRILRDPDLAVLAEGYTRHACVDASGKVVRPAGLYPEIRRRTSGKLKIGGFSN